MADRRDLLDSLLRHGERPISSVPPALPGERARSLEEMADDLARALRPPVKVSPSSARRAELNRGVLCRYRAMCDYVLSHGWSWRRIAREAECTVEHVQACYDGSRNVPGWLLEAFPAEAQGEAIRVHIDQVRCARKAG
jgi:hypothetical protein